MNDSPSANQVKWRAVIALWWAWAWRTGLAAGGVAFVVHGCLAFGQVAPPWWVNFTINLAAVPLGLLILKRLLDRGFGRYRVTISHE